MSTILIKRGTRSQLNTAASANQLKVGEPYLITDEDRIAIGTSASTYSTSLKESESTFGSIDGGWAGSNYGGTTVINGGGA